MAFVYTRSITKMLQREATAAIDLDGDTIKIGLSTAVHVANKDDQFLSDAGADDFEDGENDIGGTGYTAGFGGAGRKTLTNSGGVTNDLTNDRSKFDTPDPSAWTAFNPANAVNKATILKEITSNAASPLIANLDFASVDPNGLDFSVSFHADGILYIAT